MLVHLLMLAADVYLACALVAAVLIVAALAVDAFRLPASRDVPSAEYANMVVYGSRHARNETRDRRAA